ncbi:MAG TPA: VWA domain-containing protein [Thermoanaerobaculia bacterium]|jgi:VWFA-related protein|nr:VWA domain-containing protein [Thermoanaerobaculia bacterium]
MRRLLIALLLATPLLSTSAQRIAESVQVTVIEVPVTVADRGGNSVRGLAAENFEVYVDGRRVPIEYFETVDLTTISAGAPKQGATAVPVAAYRNFLLMFDVANSEPGITARAKEAAKQFVETQLRARDLVAVSTYTNEQGARMITSFTRDRELLLNAIRTLGDAKYFKPADPLLISAKMNPFEPEVVDGMEGLAAQHAKELDARSTQIQDIKNREQIRTQIQNFGVIARALDRLRGQKQIILLSQGFDARLVTGRTDLLSEAAQRENQAAERGQTWLVDTEQRFGSASATNEISGMAEIFRRSDVRLHAIDIRGVRSDVDAREGLKKSNNEGLFLVTRPTGGTVIRNSNDLSGQFDQLLRQQEVIYLLGFTSKETGKPGTFHKINVKLAGAKGDVTHRAGYYEVLPQMNALEATLSLSELIMTDTEVRDVPLAVSATPVPGANERARVPVVIDVTGAKLLEGVSTPNMTANVFVYAFDGKGQVVDYAQQRIALDLTQTAEAVRATGVRYVSALDLPPGEYSLKTLVRVDETGRIGLSQSRVVVPKFGATAVLRPVAAGPASGWVTLVSPTRGAVAAEILALGETPFIPGTRVEIASGAEQQIVLMVRGLPADKLSITPMLVSPDGSARPAPVTLAGRTSPDAHGVAKLLYKFQPLDVAAGSYELKFTVVPQGSLPTVVGLPVVVK